MSKTRNIIIIAAIVLAGVVTSMIVMKAPNENFNTEEAIEGIQEPLNANETNQLNEEPSNANETSTLNEKLIEAVTNGDIGQVRQLVDKGADVNSVSSEYFPNGYTALMIASKEGYLDIVKFLVEKGANVNAVTPKEDGGFTVLMIAVLNQNMEVVKFLVEKGADVNSSTGSDLFGTTPLIMASGIGNLDIVKLLINNGANVNDFTTGDVEGNTALMMASQNGHLDIVKFLVENGADINAAATFQSRVFTALRMASELGHSDVVKFLIENGADNNVANQKAKASQDSVIDKTNIEISYQFEPNDIKNIYEPERIFTEESTGLKKKTIDLGDQISMELVYIPAGEFMMGRPTDANVSVLINYNEKPQHQVKFSKGFWMGLYEVTNSQYQQFIKESNYDGKRESNANYLRHILLTNFDSPDKGSDYPVIWISWDNAMAFCKWLSVKEGRTYRLPTEAEWEYSCRADLDAPLDIKDDGLFIESSDGRATSQRTTHPASQGTPNEYGLYDMYDNVREWCLDWFGLYSEDAQVDPKGPESGERRVVRGDYSGSIISYSYTERSNRLPNEPSNEIGFRVVCEDFE